MAIPAARGPSSGWAFSARLTYDYRYSIRHQPEAIHFKNERDAFNWLVKDGVAVSCSEGRHRARCGAASVEFFDRAGRPANLLGVLAHGSAPFCVEQSFAEEVRRWAFFKTWGKMVEWVRGARVPALHRLEAFGPGGGRIDIDDLPKPRVRGYGYFSKGMLKHYRRRSGPVPFVSRSRGYRFYRPLHTTAERRLNAAVADEYGDGLVRPARLNLPSTWDDRVRHIERGWKAQHKGRKSWDRVR